jgi:hypothetical protein
MQFFKDLIQEPVKRGCVFSALVGIESLYLFLRASRRHMLLFWLFLLPILAGCALADFAMRTALQNAYLDYLYPFLGALLAALAACVLTGMMRFGAQKEPSLPGAEALLFASFTALLLMLAQQGALQTSAPLPLCAQAIYLWMSYGLGVLAFWSLGHRLRRNGQSPAGSMVVLYCILAIVAATLTGFVGGKF